MMPKRIAAPIPTRRSPTPRLNRPLHLQKDEWKPGEEEAVYVKTPHKPRAEPRFRLAGGKVAKVDRAMGVGLANTQTQVKRADQRRVD